MSDQNNEDHERGEDENEEFDKIFGQGGEDAGPPVDGGQAMLDPSEAFADLEPGTYSAAVDVVKNRQSKSGDPMLEVPFFVTEGEMEGARITKWFMLVGKGAGYTVKFLKALDLREEAKGRKPINLAEMKGKLVTIVVGRQDGSEDFMEVKSVRRHPQGPNGNEAEPF